MAIVYSQRTHQSTLQPSGQVEASTSQSQPTLTQSTFPKANNQAVTFPVGAVAPQLTNVPQTDSSRADAANFSYMTDDDSDDEQLAEGIRLSLLDVQPNQTAAAPSTNQKIQPSTVNNFSLFSTKDNENMERPPENNVEDFLTCPITLEVMKKPVILVPEGETYEEENILRWLKEHRVTPIHKKPLPDGVKVETLLVPNRALQHIIESSGLLKQEQAEHAQPKR